jgi:protein-disulfide isomerase
MEKYYKGRLQEFTQVFPVINQYDPIKGSAAAKVTIYEYSDFLCPSCLSIQNDLKSLEKLYGSDLNFVFKGLPLVVATESRPALLAAYCANEQSKFWEYYDLLFQNTASLNQQEYLELANKLGLNMEQFTKCQSDNRYEQILDRNLTDSMSLQITSIPTLYINKEKVEGYFNYDNLKKIIDQQMR